jgi:hypothetical protein
MNVFLCCFQSPEQYHIRPHRFWLETFDPALRRLGHDVIEPQGLDFVAPFTRWGDRSWLRSYRARTSEELVRQVREAHDRVGVDLFFSYFYAVHVFPDAIEAIGKLGIPTVNFFCDNLREFHHVAPIVDAYTLNWVPEKEACALYHARGAPYAHLPFGGDPGLHRVPAGPELPQVTFVGSVDGLRTRLLAQVLPSGLPMHVHGHGWQPGAARPSGSGRVGGRWGRIKKSIRQHGERIRHFGVSAEMRHLRHRSSVGLELLGSFGDLLHPAVDHETLLQLAARSAVFLGINRCPHPGYPVDAPLVYSRLRDIEAPMMGACYLTEYCEELEDLFEIGTEIAVYRTAEDLREQARRLLLDPVARSNLRRRGRAAAVARHTWKRRIESLLGVLGLATVRT